MWPGKPGDARIADTIRERTSCPGMGGVGRACLAGCALAGLSGAANRANPWGFLQTDVSSDSRAVALRGGRTDAPVCAVLWHDVGPRAGKRMDGLETDRQSICAQDIRRSAGVDECGLADGCCGSCAGRLERLANGDRRTGRMRGLCLVRNGCDVGRVFVLVELQRSSVRIGAPRARGEIPREVGTPMGVGVDLAGHCGDSTTSWLGPSCSLFLGFTQGY